VHLDILLDDIDKNSHIHRIVTNINEGPPQGFGLFSKPHGNDNCTPADITRVSRKARILPVSQQS
jgi:hypothetical protein